MGFRAFSMVSNHPNTVLQISQLPKHHNQYLVHKFMDYHVKDVLIVFLTKHINPLPVFLFLCRFSRLETSGFWKLCLGKLGQTPFCCEGKAATYIYIYIYVYIYISGRWYSYPSEKYESQLGWWHSQYLEKWKMFQTTNQHFTFWNIVHVGFEI